MTIYMVCLGKPIDENLIEYMDLQTKAIYSRIQTGDELVTLGLSSLLHRDQIKPAKSCIEYHKSQQTENSEVVLNNLYISLARMNKPVFLLEVLVEYNAKP
eukprot:UN09266